MASVLLRALKAFLAVLLWGLFVFWVVEWFLYPTDRWTSWKADAIERTNSKFFELNGEFGLIAVTCACSWFGQGIESLENGPGNDQKHMINEHDEHPIILCPE